MPDALKQLRSSAIDCRVAATGFLVFGIRCTLDSGAILAYVWCFVGLSLRSTFGDGIHMLNDIWRAS